MATNSFNPLNYTGVEAVKPADEIRAQRAPTAADRRYKLGTVWYDQVASTVWKLTQAHGGSATWTAMGTGAVGGIVTLSGDAVVPVPPVAGDLAILGTAAQGVTSTEGVGSITISVLDATTAQKGVSETSTDAETIAGASDIVTVTPASLAAKLGAQTDHGLLVGSGAAAAVTALAVATDGQLIIGSNGADPVPATVTSADSSITFTPGAGTLAMSVTQATTTQLGGAQTATNSETLIGTSTTVVTTPSNLVALKGYTDITFSQNPVLQSALTTGVAPTGATGDVNLMMCQDGVVMEQFIIGAGQTIIAPRMDADGLLISLDLTATEGAEYNFGVLANGKHSYTIGTSPAFFVEAQFDVADVTGCEPLLVGFRKNDANNGTYTAYTDYALIGLNNTVNPGSAIIEDVLNGGAAVQTDTTDGWVDGARHTLRVLVSAAGAVTYTIDGVAPTATHAFTFDNADVVVPCIHLVHGAAAPGAIELVSFKCGLQ